LPDFTIKKDFRFEKLIQTLSSHKIISCKKKTKKCKQVTILNKTTLDVILCNIFLLYLTPKDDNVFFSPLSGECLLKGHNIQVLFSEKCDDTTSDVLKNLITEEKDDVLHEGLFNAMLCIYIGSMKPLRVIYPNTSIMELEGKKSLEFDILFEDENEKFYMIEITRGVDKSLEEISDSYKWHFKKALFKKWAIEKIYDITNCEIIYITINELQRDKLIDEILKRDSKIYLIELKENFQKPITYADIKEILNQGLIDRLESILNS